MTLIEPPRRRCFALFLGINDSRQLRHLCAHGSEQLLELAETGGFRQMAGKTGFLHLHAPGLFAECGQGHQFRSSPGRRFPNPAGGLKPVHFRHGEIEKHQLRLELRADLEPRRTAVRDPNFGAQDLEQESQGLSHIGQIVDHQNAPPRF